MKSATLTVGMVAILVGYSLSASAQENFGDQLRKWVDNDVPGLSRRIVAADFPVRVHNIFVAATEANLDFVGKADAELRELHVIMQSDWAAGSLQGVRAALDLQANAFEVQARLMRLQSGLEDTQARLEVLASKDLDLLFARSGAYNVGYAGVFASFADIAKAAPTSFSARYPQPSVTYVIGEDGKQQVNLTSPGAGLSVAGGITIGRAIALAWGASATKASIWASMITLWYAIWKFHDANEEFKKQSDTFENAVADFPNKTMPVPEQLALFKSIWAEATAAHEPVVGKVQENRQVIEDRLKSAIAWNAARLALSRTLVTREKLRDAVSADVALPADKRIFSAVKNQAALSDLRKLEGYTRVLGARIQKVCGGVEGVNFAEEYARSGAELGHLARSISDRPAFAPIHAKAAALAKEFRAENFDVRKIASDVGSRNCGFAIKKKIAIEKKATIKNQADRQIALRRKSTRQITVQATFLAQYAAPGLSYCFTNVSGHGCSYRDSAHPDYRSRFPPVTGDPVLTSPGDGGYVDVLPSATKATDAATRQIESRISFLTEQKAQIDSQRPQWLNSNVSALVDSGVAQTASLARERANATAHSVTNAAALSAIEGAIRNFVSGPLTSFSSAKLSRDADIEAVSPRNVPIALVRDGGPELAILRQREASGPAVSVRDLERARFDEDMDIVERRLEGASAAKPDPVFKDGSAFRRLREYGKQSLVMADRLSQERRRMTPIQASRSDRAVDGALMNVKASRYYAWGYSGARFLYDSDVLGWSHMKSHMVNTISEFISCNAKNRGYEDIRATPCNVMVGTALNRLWGVNDFGERGPFLLANDVAKYVANSPEWTLVGPALSQEALDDAGMLAALGRPVISVWVNPLGGPGHVNLILPGVPYEQARFRTHDWGDTRVPRVINFHWCTAAGGCDPASDQLTFSDDTIDRAYQRLSSGALKNVLIYVRDRKAP